MIKVHRRNKPARIQDTKRDIAFYFLNDVLLFMALAVCLYPILYVAANSFSSPRAVTSGKVYLWPVEPTLLGYETVFKNKDIITGYTNTLIYTVVGTAMNVAMTLAAAYALSRRELVGYRFFNFMFAFTMWFSGGMIPSYLLMQSLGFINTRWAMWVPGMLGVWNVIITRAYFQSNIPADIYESATLDGCGYSQYFFRITLPLSGAIIAVIALFYAVGHWNAYFNAFLYINKKELFPLQIVLRDILIQNQIDNESMIDAGSAEYNYGLPDLLKYSLIMVACAPVWCIYPFVQKYFVRGIMVGAIKG